MNNKIVLVTVSFVAGAGLGFLVGYNMNRKEAEEREQAAMEAFKEYSSKSEEPKEEKTQGEDSGKVIRPAKFAKPDGDTGINYKAYTDKLKEAAESESPSEDDDEEESIDPDDEEFKETYEERIEREANEYIEHAEKYKKAHAGKIEVMRSDEWDTDFPETDYDREDIYYFTESDTLTDEDGTILSEEEYIGLKPRQIGWMRSPDDELYIRNHPKETEYRVLKERCSVEEWF